MSKIDTVILGILFGALPVLLCLLLMVIIGLSANLTGDQFGPYAFVALGTGLAINIIFLKRWVAIAFRMSSTKLAMIYIFYSIGALGLGMGVPIFNFAVGITAGAFTGRKTRHDQADQCDRHRNIKKTALFTAAVLMIMCSLTGLWAIVGGLVGAHFETPVGSFTFTVPIIIACVICGGLILCSVQYWLTTVAAKITLRLSR
ncbi:MAG: hypothetical protein ACYTFK_00840 [Planctomycetota bacterium]